MEKITLFFSMKSAIEGATGHNSTVYELFYRVQIQIEPQKYYYDRGLATSESWLLQRGIRTLKDLFRLSIGIEDAGDLIEICCRLA